jgi:hypothetical protein
MLTFAYLIGLAQSDPIKHRPLSTTKTTYTRQITQRQTKQMS